MRIVSTSIFNGIGGLAIAALVTACGSGGGGGSGPLSGQWIGPIQSDEAGPGEVTVSFNQSGERLTGTWVSRFDDPAFDNEGTLRGTAAGDTIDVFLDSSNPDLCDFDAIGVRDGDDRITGSYETSEGCARQTGGTFDIVRN